MRKPYFKLVDYIIMAMMAAMGIAIKVIIVPLSHIITGPLFIPGGVVAGGFYMAFLVLGEGITKKRGSATIIALIQAVIVTITGTIGSHGAASLLTYTLSGIAVDVLMFIIRGNCQTLISCFFAGIIANLSGSYSVNLAIFNLSFVPLMVSLCTASLSGGFGGLIAYGLSKNIRSLGILKDKTTRKFDIEIPEECDDKYDTDKENNSENH